VRGNLSASRSVWAAERFAIVGPSGGGKSTLVSLLPRLYDVTAGKICVDGVELRDYLLSALRGAIAIVSQDSFVFTGTIRDTSPTAGRSEPTLRWFPPRWRPTRMTSS